MLLLASKITRRSDNFYNFYTSSQNTTIHDNFIGKRTTAKRTLPRRTIATQDNHHPGQLPVGTWDNRHSGPLPSGKLSRGKLVAVVLGGSSSGTFSSEWICNCK